MDEPTEIFMKTLKELEALVAARQYIPKENETFESLKDIIERSSMALREQHSKSICTNGKFGVEYPRLVKIYGLLHDVPKAKDGVKTILESAILHASTNRLQEDDGSTDSHYHRILLDIWQCLQLKVIDRGVLEDAVLTGLFSENSTSRPSIPRPLSVTATGQPSETRKPGSRQGEEAKPSLLSVPVSAIRFSKKIFSNVCLAIVQDRTNLKLELYVQKKLPVQGDPRMIIDINNVRTVLLSESRLYMVLDYNNIHESSIRVWMHTSKEAEMFIQKLKGLKVFLSVVSLDDVKEEQNDGPSSGERKHDDSDDQGSPARTVKHSNKSEDSNNKRREASPSIEDIITTTASSLYNDIHIYQGVSKKSFQHQHPPQHP
ncbi:MAG: hypothetical protein Q9196_003931 [Gyalolechia fulgens]